MQRMLVSRLMEGMITARNVFSADGIMLLAADKEITAAYIRRLEDLGIYAIYVRNPLCEDVEIPLVISEETRLQSMRTVKRGFEVLRNKQGSLPIGDVKVLGWKLVSEVLRNRQAMIHLTDIRTHDDYTFAHCVDVATLAVLIASQLGYGEEKLRELAVGALLHDVGKVQVDPFLLNKPESLSDDEMVMMRGHALFGFEILRKHGSEISLPSIHIALQHHEKNDGTGYPRGLKNDEIHEYARIVAVADVYDAVTSDRPYRKALLPHEACEIMKTEGCRHFDPHILPLLLSRIAVYPIGAVVRLNTGDIGVVMHVEMGEQTRPKIRLIMDKHRRLYPKGVELDMRNHLTVLIDQVVDGRELFTLI